MGPDFDVRIRLVCAGAPAYFPGMTATARSDRLDTAAHHRALDSRDARFDGVFFVGITSTGIYCRPVCPAKVSYPERRRFFETAANAEHAGYRPCLRCRPELAPGRAPVDAVSRLAAAAAHRIEGGALNGSSVGTLAAELGVSERHLRRSLEREFGVAPLELAQTHRLLLAKRLLADTALSVTRIAYASGFQSLRRFNAVFQERYRLSPRELRRPSTEKAGSEDGVHLSLAYRSPYAWEPLLDAFRREAILGVEVIEEGRYTRALSIEGKAGVISVEDVPARQHLSVQVSASLVPVLMPLLARLRHCFDLDAEPAMIEKHLTQGGLGASVRKHPGLRLPGTMEGFEVVLRAVGGGAAKRVVERFGTEYEGGVEGLTHLVPTAKQIVAAGVDGLMVCGMGKRKAQLLVRMAEEVVAGRLALKRGGDAEAMGDALRAMPEMEEALVTTILIRALGWPDAFPSSDPRAARAEQWRPWRGYAALHLAVEEGRVAGRKAG
jgi:AraC family transcriptional regulator, regulatory protein of adaptative response / DNA-3-methyladenine glycosylase II